MSRKHTSAAVEIPMHADAMHIEWWPIGDPIPYEKNARKWSDQAIAKVAASIREYGWRQPIVVDKDHVIVIGHLRLASAFSLKLTHVPVHMASDLTEAQIKGLRLADNRTHEEATWDDALLGQELFELKALDFNLAMTGFDDAAIATLLAAADPDASKSGGGTGDAEETPAPAEDPASRTGDLWTLGGHRLLCGDSTKQDDVERLMDGQKADLVFTDPPYNVDYDPESRPNGPTSADRMSNPLGKIMNDKKTPEAFRGFLDLVYSNINFAVKPGRAIYICHADTEGHHFRNAFIAQPWKLQSCLIWKKTVLVFGRADYHWMHEPILYGWKEGAPHVWCGDRKHTTIIEIPTDHANRAQSDTGGKYVHPTQKPVALMRVAIDNSSAAGELVLDLFGGSGSTLIACEQSGRKARLVEMDPRFVDVIIKRWQTFSGKEATLAGDGRTYAGVAALRERKQ